MSLYTGIIELTTYTKATITRAVWEDNICLLASERCHSNSPQSLMKQNQIREWVNRPLSQHVHI